MSSAPESDAMIIEEALDEVFAGIERMPRSPHTRELSAQANAYRTSVRRWPTFAPSAAQRVALMELVMDLHARVRSDRITVPPTQRRSSRPPPSGRAIGRMVKRDK